MQGWQEIQRNQKGGNGTLQYHLNWTCHQTSIEIRIFLFSECDALNT